MAFWKEFESATPGIDDTIEWVLRIAVATLATIILVVVLALVVALFVSNEVVDNRQVFELIGPAFNTVIGAFVGLLGGLSVSRAMDKPTEPAPLKLNTPAPEPEPVVSQPVVDHQITTNPVVSQETASVIDNEDDDDMEPWEKYRNDLRYDTNGDGQVTEEDFPDWRNPG